MDFQLIPFLTYAAATTFTPGPNNISAAGLGMRQGYRRSLPFLSGIFCGFFLVMLSASIASNLLSSTIPRILPVMKYIGAAYITWLGWKFVRLAAVQSDERSPDDCSSEQAIQEPAVRGFGFLQGVLLQAVNIKVHLYGLTIFTLFIRPSFPGVLSAGEFSFLLAALSFTSISLWNLLGYGINRTSSRPIIRKIFFAAAALMLIYSAVSVLTV